MNVQYIHNKTFFAGCPPEVLARARALANYHEAGIFSSSNLSSIHNGQYSVFSHFSTINTKIPVVPAQAVLPTLFDSFGRLSNTSDTLLFHSISISYKPFLALFEMMGMTYPATNLTGISAFVFCFVYVVANVHPSCSEFSQLCWLHVLRAANKRDRHSIPSGKREERDR